MKPSFIDLGGRHEHWVFVLHVAAQEVFALMLGSTLDLPADPSAPAGEKLDITAVVGLAGRLCGVLTVCCSQRSAARMTARMLGDEAGASAPEIWDAVGEVANMIAGNFKSKICGLGDACILSLPTVISGADYSLHTFVNEHLRTVLLFEGDPLVLALEIHADNQLGNETRKPASLSVRF